MALDNIIVGPAADLKVADGPRLAEDNQSRPADGILRRAGMLSGRLERIAGADNPLDVVVDESLSPVEAVIRGRPTLLFGTNNYLGLSFHPSCVQAAQDALTSHGTGSTASRVAGGNHQLHTGLEQDIARLYGRRHATVFSTGFMANLGVISALVREGNAIFIDAHCHASIYDACRMSGAHTRTFRHNDAADLDRLFEDSDVAGELTLVVVEGVYSVWGDLGDLPAIAATVKRHGGVLVVDEAHAMGLYGERGRGASEFLGVENDVDVIVGTFSKSVGVIGGYAVTNLPQLRMLRLMSRPYLYTASLPPAVVASAREALRLISTDRGLRDAFWRNARDLHEGLTSHGLKLQAAAGPVGSVRMPGQKVGCAFWQALLEAGIYVNIMVPPATPAGEVMLRYSVSAAHTPEHIRAAVAAFHKVARSLAVV